MRSKLTLAFLAAALSVPAGAARGADDTIDAAGVKFRPQEIDRSLKVGYAVKLLDLNGDGKLDVAVVDSARVVWFENPGGSDPSAAWKLHTIVDNKQAGIKADNVCFDFYDVDGDGKLDCALGADWQPANVKAGGSLHWLQQGKNIDDPWAAHPIMESEPTLHRIRWAHVDDSGKPALVVAPLKGKDSTQAANFTDHGTRLLAFPIPKDPAKDKWEPVVLTDQLHVNHNILPLAADKDAGLLTASYEGVNRLTRGADGKRSLTKLGAGNQENPKASLGSSEVKVGKLKGGRELIATIEPFHGNQAVVYEGPADGKGLLRRGVLDDALKEGHGLWCADLDGDGEDEVVVGWRAGDKPGLRVFKAGPPGPDSPTDRSPVRGWHKFELDPGGVAVEDLACADLNGDGKVDIVAVGRATHNVKIYWNAGK